jgi:hypothetical protein
MPRKIENRDEGAKFDVVIPDNLPELYVDGIANVQVGLPVTRLLLHTVTVPIDESNDVEERTAKLSIVIPTHAFFEIVANIASSTAHEAVASAQVAGGQYASQVLTQVTRLAELTELKNKASSK